MKANMPSVFISYSSDDRAFARRLTADLRALGIAVWLDEDKLDIGDSFLEGIAEGISQSNFFIALLSKNSVTSHWVRKELNLAMHKEISTGNKVILPVRIDSCVVPAILMDKLHFDAFDEASYIELIPRLIRAFRIERAPSSVPHFLPEEVEIIKKFEQRFEETMRDDRLYEYRQECQEAADLITEVASEYPGKYNHYIEVLYNSSLGIPTYKAGLVRLAAERALGL